MAGLTAIPAHVIEVGSDAQMLEIALVENLQREDLDPLEVAQGYQRLIDDCNLKQEDVAVKVGKDRSTVANTLRLLKLPPDVQAALRNRRISMGHARAILALTTEARQLSVLREIINRELSVRKTEALVKDLELGRKDVARNGEIRAKASKASATAVPAQSDTSLQAIENSLRHVFGTQVKVRMKGDDSGSIDVEFYSLEELERLLDIMMSIPTSSEQR
jgi:ParB family chromosome partitioning protein